MWLAQHTGGKHSLDIVCNITEDGTVAFWMAWLGWQWLDLNTLDDRLTDLILGVVEYGTGVGVRDQALLS